MNEITEEGVKSVISNLGLDIVNVWFDGNKSRPVYDCKKESSPTICVWTEPPYEAKVWIKDANPRQNQFTEDITSLIDLEENISNIIGDGSPTDEQLNAAAEKISAPDYHAEGAYEDLTDIGGDFEAVEFYKDVKAVCDIAGKPALAEAVIKLHKAYHPVLEAEATPHVIPKEIAIAVNNAQAEDYGWRPETTEHAFEGTWDWLEDHADTVLDAWNATNDPREVIKAVEGDEEHTACMYDGI